MDVILIGLGIGGIIAACIASVKNRSTVGWFFLGLLFGLIGVLIVGVLPSAAPGPPRGMRREYCKRCNAIQNVSACEPSYECWQCKQVNQVGSLKRPA